VKPTLFPVVWQPRLRALLFQQFRNLPPKDFSVSPPRSVIEAVSDYFAQEAQELEDAAQEVLSIVSIDDSSGVQLQELGRLVGQPFSGESDALFRLRIRARIAANRSSGDPESLYLVFVTMFSLAGQKGQAKILSSPGSIAEFVFRVLGFTLDQRTAAALLDLLLAATVGGDRLLLEWSSAVPSGAFQCSDANGPAATRHGLRFDSQGRHVVWRVQRIDRGRRHVDFQRNGLDKPFAGDKSLCAISACNGLR